MEMLITVVMTLIAVVGMRIARDGDGGDEGDEGRDGVARDGGDSHLVCGDNVS